MSRDADHEAGSGQAGLEVFLLGPPKILWAGHPLVIPRRQARALLYRLVSGGQPVPREALCFLFWPDVPDGVARRRLTHLLTHLRRALPDPGILLEAEDQIGLVPEQTWSDVAAFQRLCGAISLRPRTS
ncbi:MAG: AfsR/SARP family transcriptional regulator, partial [Chloroflexia bacterium]